MNLTELCNEVYTLTNRSDLVAETKAAVRSATLKLHQVDYFYKDLYETGVVFSPAAYKQEIEYRTLIPRFRSLKYIRKADSTGAGLDFLEVLTIPEQIVDSYKINKTDVCYVAGSVIQIYSSTELAYAILGCYIAPDITEATFNSWIAVDHPFAIIYEAAAKVFKMTGKTEEFAAHTAMAADERAAVIVSNIQAVGY